MTIKNLKVKFLLAAGLCMVCISTTVTAQSIVHQKSTDTAERPAVEGRQPTANYQVYYDKMFAIADTILMLRNELMPKLQEAVKTHHLAAFAPTERILFNGLCERKIAYLLFLPKIGDSAALNKALIAFLENDMLMEPEFKHLSDMYDLPAGTDSALAPVLKKIDNRIQNEMLLYQAFKTYADNYAAAYGLKARQ